MAPQPRPLPDTILIVGGGVFGLSTALSLARRHTGQIILIESAPTIPNPEGSSVDTSRIIRSDYAKGAYASLAATAIEKWRGTDWGGEDRYNQNGLVIVSSASDSRGGEYVRKSYENVKALAGDGGAVQELATRRDVEKTVGYAVREDVAGGYVNWGSGWGDAEAGVRFARKKLDETGRVGFRTGEVTSLITDVNPAQSQQDESKQLPRVTGVRLADNTQISADLVILATGAWTGRLIDLRGRADASGQVLAYIQITDTEQEQLRDIPTLLNLSTGMFIMPPRNNLLKIARHSYGYRNPVQVSTATDAKEDNNKSITASLPEPGVPIPPEGEQACRAALREMLPAFAERPFVKTRVCWYTDTPNADFIITHHPSYAGNSLFLATGGSGHGYKFLPVIGDKIVDAIQGILDPDLAALWAWSAAEGGSDGTVWCEDGSRSGVKGQNLREELARTRTATGTGMSRL